MGPGRVGFAAAEPVSRCTWEQDGQCIARSPRQDDDPPEGDSGVAEEPPVVLPTPHDAHRM